MSKSPMLCYPGGHARCECFSLVTRLGLSLCCVVDSRLRANVCNYTGTTCTPHRMQLNAVRHSSASGWTPKSKRGRARSLMSMLANTTSALRPSREVDETTTMLRCWECAERSSQTTPSPASGSVLSLGILVVHLEPIGHGCFFASVFVFVDGVQNPGGRERTSATSSGRCDCVPHRRVRRSSALSRIRIRWRRRCDLLASLELHELLWLGRSCVIDHDDASGELEIPRQ